MFEQLEKASKTLLQSTENFLGLWAMVAQSFPGGQNQEDKNGTLVASGQAPVQTQGAVSNDEAKALEGECEDDVETKAKREMFQTAESAVEAWAMLATSLGGQSFVKSEFEKMCFLENRRTDTEVSMRRFVRPCLYTRKQDASYVYCSHLFNLILIFSSSSLAIHDALS